MPFGSSRSSNVAVHLQREVRLQPGGTINGSTVLEDVDWLNQNPFRQVKAEFQAGAQEGETDVTYRVHDRAPWRLYTSFQNNGSRTTGRGRLAAGFQWGDVFGLGHIASYQATVAPEPGRFSAHALSYRIPLPWRDNLVLSGNISRSDPDLANNFTQVAESSQVSARYHWRLPRLEALSHRIEIGPDFKRSTSNLNFFGTPVLTGTTEIVQLVTAYEAERPDDWGSSSAGISLTYSPGGLTGANESADFQPSNTRSGRQFADANYAYVQVHAERTTNLPEGFSLFNRVAAQVSNGNLLSSEQFGLGGSGSIRGYDERAVNGDRGALLSSELRSPGFSLLGAFGAGDIKDRMQVLAFWDYGFASLHQRAAGEPNTTYLSAVGVGLRYGIDRYLSLSADLGVPLRDVAGAENRSAWAHVAVTLSY
jgi:hemolysin activation/secretion protein